MAIGYKAVGYMCGFLGILGEFDFDLASACLDRLAHRGPDGRGIWTDAGIFLGHRRLAIIDVSENGTQPMHWAGRFHIVFNGEIYNYREIRADLSRAGYSFQTLTDTEVILAAFDRWGPDCVNRFNGMWALAIWDSLEKRLFLSRDRFGVKPLFYSVQGNQVFFGSEMKAIMPFLKSPSINQSLVKSAVLNPHYESGADCLVAEIKRFPAAHNAWVFPDGTLEMDRYWCTLDHWVTMPTRYDDQVQQLRELLENAVSLRLRSDVPVGTALSGGVDSSAIAALMNAVMAPTAGATGHRAFVSSFPGAVQDETQLARQVANHIGIPIQPIVADTTQLADRMDNDMYHVEELFPGIYTPFIATYEAMKQAGVTVSLDGHGADEIFGGYAFDLQHHFWDLGVSDSRRLYRLIQSMSPNPVLFPTASAFKLIGVYKLKQYVKQLIGRGIVPDISNGHPNWSRLSGLDRILYWQTHHQVLPTLLRNYDRFSMASGVEIRMPFMDYRVVCWGLSAPAETKRHGWRSKGVVRDAVASLLPSQIVNRVQKVGWNAPMVEWMTGPLKSYVLDLVHSRVFYESNLIQVARVRSEAIAFYGLDQPTFSQAMALWGQIQPVVWESAFFNRARRLGV